MCCWIVLLVCFDGANLAQEQEAPASQPSATSRRSSLRKPAAIELVERLLRKKEARAPILPVARKGPIGIQQKRGKDARRDGLFLEGTMLMERTGRLVRDGKNSHFEFDALGPGRALRRLQIVPNSLLEQMEREAAAGIKAFKITAEVTLYGGRNYLLLKKENPITTRGNLKP